MQNPDSIDTPQKDFKNEIFSTPVTINAVAKVNIDQKIILLGYLLFYSTTSEYRKCSN